MATMGGRVLNPSHLAPFLDAILSRAYTLNSQRHPHFGICVSGGPDSMALAHLLRQYQSYSSRPFKLSAWIVNHKARLESTTEACLVQKNLQNIGLEASILTMQWPDGVKPLQLSDFESQARVKRYQLLANAAATHCIQCLFLGHHQDDQVETIIMRLIRNRTFALEGLAGMAESGAIPAAFDKFGVHVVDDCSPSTISASATQEEKRARPQHKTPFSLKIVQPSGLSLQRPLLSFKKADLVATCEADGVSYVIDTTNFDPKSSLRNAVRHLRQNHTLPLALSSSRLLGLQRHALNHIRKRKAEGEAILQTCQVLSLDLRSGVVRAHIPFPEYSPDIDLNRYAYAISKLAEVVTPSIRVHHNTQVPTHIVLKFFGQARHSQPMTYDGVLFTRDIGNPQTWTLSRQPFHSKELPNFASFFRRDDSPAVGSTVKSDFLLWDNRFWIRASTNTETTLSDLSIRPLRPEDIKSIASSYDPESKHFSSGKSLLVAVKRAAPGRVKFTIPVVTYKDEIVALPTFEYYLRNAFPPAFELSLDVRYNSFSMMGRFT